MLSTWESDVWELEADDTTNEAVDGVLDVIGDAGVIVTAWSCIIVYYTSVHTAHTTYINIL